MTRELGSRTSDGFDAFASAPHVRLKSELMPHDRADPPVGRDHERQSSRQQTEQAAWHAVELAHATVVVGEKREGQAFFISPGIV